MSAMTDTGADAGARLLRGVLDAIAAKHHYTQPSIDLKEITSGGANYTSHLYLASISSPQKTPLKLFAKVGCFSDKIREKCNADRFFKVENEFYTKLVKIWDSLQEKYQVPKEHMYAFPKYYAGDLTKGRETVVLEDLTESGYGTYNRFDSVDWEYAANSVEALAKFHALSFIFEKEDPVEYAKVTKELEFEAMPESESTQEIWGRMIGSSLQVIEDEDVKAKVLKFFEQRGRNIYLDFHRPRGRPLLVHGDYRTSNLMFKRVKGVLQPIVIDYQTVHTGCPLVDLVYFIFLCSDEEFRRKHYQQLVDHYYQQLGLALKRYQMDIADVYPREEFDTDLKESLPYAVLLGVILLPVVTVEEAAAPKIDDSNADLDTFIVKPNELYTSRFRGLIRDLQKLGVL